MTLIEELFVILVSGGLGFILGQFVKISVGWVRRVPYQISKRKEK